MNTVYITPHFKWSEALHTDTGLPNLPTDYAKANLVNTFRILERVRVFCNFPLIISSGFRTPEVHTEVYKRQNKNPTKHSYHLEGRAVDISIKNLDERHFNKLYLNLLTWHPVEIYYTKSFIHVAF